MIILALDTALAACSVALSCKAEADDAPRLWHQSQEMVRGHAEALIAMADAVMAEAGLTYGDLTRIAVNTGPGSFTGLRVGVAAARGYGVALSCPVVGLSSLTLLAEAARRNHANRTVLAILEAKRGQAYIRMVNQDGDVLLHDQAVAHEDLAHITALPDLSDNLVITGTGRDLIATYAPACTATLIDATHADCRVLAEMAMSVKPEDYPAKPLYLRAPDAKPQTKGKIARQ